MSVRQISSVPADFPDSGPYVREFAEQISAMQDLRAPKVKQPGFVARLFGAKVPAPIPEVPVPDAAQVLRESDTEFTFDSFEELETAIQSSLRAFMDSARGSTTDAFFENVGSTAGRSGEEMAAMAELAGVFNPSNAARFRYQERAAVSLTFCEYRKLLTLQAMRRRFVADYVETIDSKGPRAVSTELKIRERSLTELPPKKYAFRLNGFSGQLPMADPYVEERRFLNELLMRLGEAVRATPGRTRLEHSSESDLASLVRKAALEDQIQTTMVGRPTQREPTAADQFNATFDKIAEVKAAALAAIEKHPDEAARIQKQARVRIEQILEQSSE